MTNSLYYHNPQAIIGYVLGGLEGLRGSVHEDADHYREVAGNLAQLIRENWPADKDKEDEDATLAVQG